ncbi:GNAT family N-acetyltransferase [Ktedonobacteria bacterium brp13]|nr:GNAT family N-acetyltransferase [Ktedonobacteria bacterium brp13]
MSYFCTYLGCGSGIGTALIYAVEQRAQHVGQSKVALLVDEENARAHRLYLHLGFKPERSINLYQQPHLHMIKNL